MPNLTADLEDVKIQPSGQIQPAGSCGAVGIQKGQEVAGQLRLFYIDVY